MRIKNSKLSIFDYIFLRSRQLMVGGYWGIGAELSYYLLPVADKQIFLMLRIGSLVRVVFGVARYKANDDGIIAYILLFVKSGR